MGTALILLLVTAVIGFVPIGGIALVRNIDQRRLDRERVIYRLSFPTSLEHDRVLAWLRATARTLKSSRFNLTGAQTMAFETIATENGIVHQLRVPKTKADDIIPQLRALAPGVSAVPVEDFPDYEWTSAVEIGETSKSRPLNIPDANDAVTSLLAALSPLRKNEAIIIQWVVTPARQQPLPQSSSRSVDFVWFKLDRQADNDEIAERRAKLSEPNVMAVLRVAAHARNADTAFKLIDRVRTSFRAFNSPHNAWYRVATTQAGVLARVQEAAPLPTWPAQLNAAELSALISWPVGQPHVPGLPRGASRQLPAPSVVPRQGIVLGVSNFPGDERPIALDYANSAKHMWVVGPTGVGKTVLLTNTATQMMDAGLGMLLIETKNDLFHSVLDRVPRNRLQDVIVMDIEDQSNPVGFNVLEDADPLRVIDDLEQIVANIHGDDKNIWLKEVMYHGLRTLITRPGATIADLPALLSPRAEENEWREELIRSLTDSELLYFWQRMDNQGRQRQDQIVAPVLSRFWHFNARQSVRNMFGQRQSAFRMDEVVRDGKILLVNLTGIDRDATKIIGSMLVNSAWKAVRRQHLAKPFYFVADEAQNLMHLPISVEDMLAQARSFKFGIVMANQAAHQLPPQVRDAVQANARTKVAFQLEVNDAKLMASHFGTRVDENDFMNLPAYECIARIATEGGVSDPVSFRASPPMPSRRVSQAARAASRTAFGKPAAEVNAEIASWRRVPESSTRKRPTLSGEDW